MNEPPPLRLQFNLRTLLVATVASAMMFTAAREEYFRAKRELIDAREEAEIRMNWMLDDLELKIAAQQLDAIRQQYELALANRGDVYAIVRSSPSSESENVAPKPLSALSEDVQQKLRENARIIQEVRDREQHKASSK